MNSIVKNTLRGALILVSFAVAGTLLLSGTFELTKKDIAQREKEALLENLSTVMPKSLYNNAIEKDWIRITDFKAFQNNEPVYIYRARKDDVPSGLVLTTTAHEGYSGNIQLIIGIKANGEITGVRVLSHKETPGLGDKIEIEKHNWILSFNNTSLANLSVKEWAVKKDGGQFDQFTGATITPRAIVKAVKRTLDFYKTHKNALFTQDSLGQESPMN